MKNETNNNQYNNHYKDTDIGIESNKMTSWNIADNLTVKQINELFNLCWSLK